MHCAWIVHDPETSVLVTKVHCKLHVQAIIGNYAVPILEDKQVWGTSDDTRTAYLDSQDVARMALAALRCTSNCMSPPAALGSRCYVWL